MFSSVSFRSIGLEVRRFGSGLGVVVLLATATAPPALAQKRAQPTAPAPAAGKPVSARSLLDQGRALYEDARYEESIQTLSAAMLRPDGTDEDKRLIYQYLAFDYIVLGRKDEAESATRALFVLDPAFELPAKESPRLREFFVASKQKWEADGKPGLVEKTVPPAPVVVRHTAPAQVDENKTFDVRGSLDDPDHRVTHVRLYVRAGTKGRFETRQTSMAAAAFSATVPGVLVKAPIIEYYFEAFDRSGLPVASRGDAGQPLRIAVKEKSKGWIAPVAIGSGVLGAAAVFGILALAGVFSSSSAPPNNPPPGTPTSTVTIVVPE